MTLARARACEPAPGGQERCGTRRVRHGPRMRSGKPAAVRNAAGWGCPRGSHGARRQRPDRSAKVGAGKTAGKSEGLGISAHLWVGCVPDDERDEAKREQAIQQVVPSGGIEVWPDLRPRLAHEPLPYGDVEAGHESSQDDPKQKV